MSIHLLYKNVVYMGRLIGEGYEYTDLYYFGTNPRVFCFTSMSLKLLHDRSGNSHLSTF